jgi:alpha-L-arabinofuranosidase
LKENGMSSKRIAVRVVFIVLASAGIDSRDVHAREFARIEIDAKQTGMTISPLLFGQNIEHTRRAITHGISAEMIANRKFAGVEKGLPTRWTMLPGGRVSIDDHVAYAGKYPVRLENSGGATSGIGQRHNWLAFRKDAKYAFRVWTKSDALQTLWIRIAEEGTTRVVFERETVAKAGDWQLWSGEFIAPATVEKATFELGGKSPGVFWIGAVSLMPADNFHGMRRDVVALLKQIKPGSLRWPGGCYAEFYRWQEGLLPVDKRPPLGPTGLSFLLPENDDYDPQELGIDEFLALCREVNAEPAITARVSENTAEDVAAMVEYCNGGENTKWGQIRVRRGHPEPYAVKYWFIGNELIAFGRGGANTPEVCGAQTLRFATAMKKVDPSVNLTGCTWCGDDKWNKALIARAGHVLDQYSAHNYLLDTFKGNPLEIPRAPTTHLRPLLANMHASLLRDVPAGRRFGIAFDEWNTKWGLQGSVAMGLYTAGALNLLCREAELLGIDRAYYFMAINEGAVQVLPLTARLDTAGEVFDLFKVHQGNRLLKTPSTAAEADIDLCASATPDGKRIHVTVVNRNAADERAVELTLRHFTATAESAVKRLIPRTLDMNEREFRQLDEKAALVDGNRVTVKLPACSIARLEFVSP